MRPLKNLIAVCTLAALALFFTGCGDDDDNDNNNNNNNNPPALGPATAAVLTDPNAVYTINVGGVTRTLRFPAAGQYQIIENGQTINGTFTPPQKNGNVWTTTLTPAAGQQGAQAGALELNFTSNTAGSFTFTPAGAAAQAGTFTATQLNPNPNPGGTNTNNPPVTNPPSGTITGKTLQLTYQGGGGEKFVFTSDTAASYENGADTATYQYNSTTGQLNILRGGGQTYGMVLTPGANTGTTTVTYQEPGGQPSNDPATFTLQ